MIKALFSILAVAALLFTGCQKDNLSTVGDGSEQLARISVNLENAGSATRAIADYGTGTTANRCILEVYLTTGDRYARLYAPVENFGAEFEIRLVTNLEYQLVAWADYVEDVNNLEVDYYYITNQDEMGLTSISPSDEVDKYDANSDKRDAFFASEPISFTEASSFELTLTRPFGQLNVLTKMTDIDPNISYLNPKSVKVEYSTELNEQFNAHSGSTMDVQPITSFSTQTIETVVDEDGYIHLTTDYILAPKEDAGQALVDFKMTFYSDENCTDEITSNDKFVNIPIQRNYRTNVYGELLSEECYISVEIDPIFEGEHNINFISTSASNIDPNEGFVDGANVTITNSGTLTESSLSNVISALENSTGEVTLILENCTNLAAGCFEDFDVDGLELTISCPSLTTIDREALKYASSIVSIELASLVTVTEYTFWNLKDLEEVILPKARNISTKAFYSCDKLEVVELATATATTAINSINSEFISQSSTTDVTLYLGQANSSMVDGNKLTTNNNKKVTFKEIIIK